MRTTVVRLLGLAALCLFTSSTANAALITQVATVQNGSSWSLAQVETLAGVTDLSILNKYNDGTGFEADFLVPNAAFGITASSDKKSGTWTYDGYTDAFGQVWSVNFFVVTAASQWTLFSVVAEAGEPSMTVNWSTAGMLNKGRRQPGYSHIAWLGTMSLEDPGCQQDCGDHPIPEPAMLALFGLGLLGLGIARRRAKK